MPGISVKARSAGTLIPGINNLFSLRIWRRGHRLRHKGYGKSVFAKPRQAMMAVENRKGIVGVMTDGHLVLDVMVAMRACLDLQDFALITDRIVLGHSAFFLRHRMSARERPT